MFTGENPEVSHIKIFGYHVYLHVPKEKISKLDPSRKKGILVGCTEILQNIHPMTPLD